MSFQVRSGDVEVSGDFSQLEKLVENLGKNYSVDVGIVGAATQTAEGGQTIAAIGAKHEFGMPEAVPPLPQRSFIVMPIATGQSKIESAVGKRYQEHIEKGEIKAIFTDIGIACEARIQEAFATGGFGTWRPLSPVTIEKKGSDAILIDTGALRQSIASKVNG